MFTFCVCVSSTAAKHPSIGKRENSQNQNLNTGYYENVIIYIFLDSKCCREDILDPPPLTEDGPPPTPTINVNLMDFIGKQQNNL